MVVRQMSEIIPTHLMTDQCIIKKRKEAIEIEFTACSY